MVGGAEFVKRSHIDMLKRRYIDILKRASSAENSDEILDAIDRARDLLIKADPKNASMARVIRDMGEFVTEGRSFELLKKNIHPRTVEEIKKLKNVEWFENLKKTGLKAEAPKPVSATVQTKAPGSKKKATPAKKVVAKAAVEPPEGEPVAAATNPLLETVKKKAKGAAGVARKRGRPPKVAAAAEASVKAGSVPSRVGQLIGQIQDQPIQPVKAGRLPSRMGQLIRQAQAQAQRPEVQAAAAEADKIRRAGGTMEDAVAAVKQALTEMKAGGGGAAAMVPSGPAAAAAPVEEVAAAVPQNMWGKLKTAAGKGKWFKGMGGLVTATALTTLIRSIIENSLEANRAAKDQAIRAAAAPDVEGLYNEAMIPVAQQRNMALQQAILGQQGLPPGVEMIGG